MIGAVVLQSRVDDAGKDQAEVGFALLPLQVEKCSQFFKIDQRVPEPILVFYRADIEAPRISKEVGHVDEPSIFADIDVEAVARFERPGDLRRIAQAQYDFRESI